MTAILPTITLETGKNPQYSIIWLHGLGADGSDFVPLVDEMELPAAVRYIFPHAPKRPVTINGGFIMRAWYDILEWASEGAQAAPALRNEDEAGIQASQQELEKLIAHERERGIPASRIFLAGFSQGGAMVLHTGLRHEQMLGGVIALSSYLPLSGQLAVESSSAARGTPIFMAHGYSDPILPFSLGRHSADTLIRQGYALTWHEYAMPHSVCPQEIKDIERWVVQRMQD